MYVCMYVCMIEGLCFLTGCSDSSEKYPDMVEYTKDFYVNEFIYRYDKISSEPIKEENIKSFETGNWNGAVVIYFPKGVFNVSYVENTPCYSYHDTVDNKDQFFEESVVIIRAALDMSEEEARSIVEEIKNLKRDEDGEYHLIEKDGMIYVYEEPGKYRNENHDEIATVRSIEFHKKMW